MKSLIIYFLSKIPIIKIIIQTRKTQTPVKLRHIFRYIKNTNLYWPVHHSSLVSAPENIVIGVDVSPGYMPGCYIQGGGGISIGDYTQISCNVGLISRNHDVYNLSKHVNVEFPSITIGKYCWIGMNVTILPGVKLPDYCIVGSGSIVTKSVDHKGSIIVGNPARVIKIIDINKIVEFRSDFEYIGFIPREKYTRYRERNLNL